MMDALGVAFCSHPSEDNSWRAAVSAYAMLLCAVRLLQRKSDVLNSHNAASGDAR